MRWWQEIAKEHFIELLLFLIFAISVVLLKFGMASDELARYLENGAIPGMIIGLYTGKAVQAAGQRKAGDGSPANRPAPEEPPHVPV